MPIKKRKTGAFSLEEWGRALVPERVRPHISDYLMKAGISEVNYSFFGALFFVGLAISLVFYFILPYGWLSGKSVNLGTRLMYLGLGSFIVLFLTLLGVSLLGMAIVYFYVDLRIYSRTKEIEKILPDFLQFVSGNLKGGMSFDRALWSAIKPRFGVLAAEIEVVAKRVMTGEDVEDALAEFTQMYDSPTLERSFELIIEGMKGGGQISYLLDKVIENLNESDMLKKEMSASVMSYVIFITFIVILVAPGLFALSFQLLQIVNSFASKIGTTAGTSMPIKFSSVSIKPIDFRNFSFLTIGVISTFASMIISIIRRGDIKGGIKYVPVFLIFSVIDYYIMLKALTYMFSSMMM